MDRSYNEKFEWENNIPNDWSIKRIKELINYIDQGWSPVAENRKVESNEWGVLKLSAIKNGKYIEDEHKALSLDTIENEMYMVKLGDILVSRSNTPKLVGDACFVNNIENKLMYSDLIYKLDVNRYKYDARYIVYALISPTIREQIEKTARGLNTSMVKISQSSIKNWIIPIPNTKEEQVIIADYLDENILNIDKRIEVLINKIDKYNEYKNNLITNMISKGRNNTKLKSSDIDWVEYIPENWNVKRMKDIFVERSEKNLNKDGNPVTTNILSVMKDIGVINHKDKGNIGNKMSKDITGYKLVYPNDIVVNKMNVMIGSVGISKEFGALSTVYIVLNIKSGNCANYFDYVFKSKSFQRHLRKIASGILEIREAVNINRFMQESIPVPPYEEQIKIVELLDYKCSLIDKSIKKIKLQINILNKYKKSLIDEVIMGKVRIKNE